MLLSPHFRLEEFTRSQIASANGIDNTPSPAQIEALKGLCLNVLEPLREIIGKPIIITSGYRSEEVNMLAGGVKHSHHRCLNQFAAADCKVNGLPAKEFFKIILENINSLPIEQVIEEHENWVHIGFRLPKKECLVASKNGRRVVYTPANLDGF